MSCPVVTRSGLPNDIEAFDGRIAGVLWGRISANRSLFDQDADSWTVIIRDQDTPTAMFRVHPENGAQAIVARDIGVNGLKILKKIGTLLISVARKPVYAVVRDGDENTNAALRFARWMGFSVGEVSDGYHLCRWTVDV